MPSMASNFFRKQIGIILPVAILCLMLIATVVMVRETYRPFEKILLSATLTAFNPPLRAEQLHARYVQVAMPNKGDADLRLAERHPGCGSGAPVLQRARTSLEAAAYKGNAKAAIQLSKIYGLGLDTAVDLPKAYAWAEVGAVEGNSVARRMRNQLLRSISATDLRAGLAQADTIFGSIRTGGSCSQGMPRLQTRQDQGLAARQRREQSIHIRASTDKNEPQTKI
jgi:hypothetical protein